MAGPFFRKPLGGCLCVASVMALASCDMSPVYQQPGFPFGASFAAKTSGAPVLVDNVAWWTAFSDPVLNDLIEQALTGNLDLKIARERVAEAQALIGAVSDPVTVSGDGSAGRRGSRTVAANTGADGNFGFDWLLDPWGGRKAELRAAEGRAEAAEAELDAARLLLMSNVATAYIDLRFQQRSLQLRQSELRSRQTTRDLMQQLEDRGAATRIDVIRAEALVSETQSLIPTVRAAVGVQQNRLAVLLGRTPGHPDTALTSGGRGQPRAGMPADIGIPADLLRNRPDIKVSERLYYAAVADIGAARANLYPTLSLGGEISLSSFGPVNARDYFFGPTLTLPALPGGPQQAAVTIRESRARQSLANWQSSVLTAIEEVENALTAYSGSLSSANSARRTVRLYQESLELTRELVGRGGATSRDLLDNEQSIATANILLAQSLRQLGQDFVILNVSLGAGNRYGSETRTANK